MNLKKNIIIVEDEIIIAEDLKITLSNLGFNVIKHFTDGTDLIKQIDSLSPDLILMDIMINGDLTGIETAEIIQRKHDIPIIYVTAYANSRILEEVKQTNPFGYIVKPFEERELHATIELAFSRSAFEIQRKQQIEAQKSLLQAFLNINSFVNMQNVEKNIISEAKKILKAEQTDFYLHDNSSDSFILKYNNNEKNNRSPFVDSIIKKTDESGSIQTDEDKINNLHFLSIPLKIGGKTEALILISRKDNIFIDSEITMMKTFSNHAETVLNNAQIYAKLNDEIIIREKAEKEIKNKLAFEQSISDISSRFVLNSNIMNSIKFTLEHITQRVNADKMFLFQSPPSNDKAYISHAYYALNTITTDFEQEEISSKLFQNWIISDLEGLIIKSHSKDGIEKKEKEVLDFFEAKSVFAFPFKIKNETQGFLVVCYNKLHINWEKQDTLLLNISSDIIGNALESNQIEEEKIFIQKQLYQSQKMETIGKLAGGIAHDFNNLLTAINGYSELALKKVKKSTPVAKDIEVILDCGQKAATLTQRLLGFSRKQIAHPIITDLNAIILDLGKMLERLIPAKVEIINSLSAKPCIIKADPGQIEQIVVNLVVNAKDAILETKKNSGTITISTKNLILEKEIKTVDNTISPGDYIVFEIIDEGCGIPEGILNKIFEPFFTTKEEGKGTGLGLSTVFGIIQQNDGYINVTSKENIGTKFSIYLRNNEKYAYQLENKLKKVEILPEGTETILFLEDEESIQDFVTSILEEQGYTVLAGDNGEDGLRIAEETNYAFNLMIADVRMPKISGPVLAQKLAKHHKNLKVLFISGHDNNELSELQLDNIKYNFLQKPFTVSSLTTKVRETLDS